MNYQSETKEETEKFTACSYREENRLEELFAKLEIKEYFFTDREGFSQHDASFTIDNKEYIVEAKVRGCNLDSFDNHIILKDKVDYLFNHWIEGRKALHVLFFHDGAIIYNLSSRFKLRQRGKENHQLIETKSLMNKNTAKDRGKVEKPSYYLTPDEKGLHDKVLIYKPNPCFFLNKKLL